MKERSLLKNFKIVYMGTPDFAVPSLRMLIEKGYDVCAVVAQPDRKAGRGHRLTPPPTKVLAEETGIPVYQFEKVCVPEGIAKIKELGPDLIVTAAFGQILTQEMLDLPSLGCINVHASLLPKLRGAAPIQWAIINGERKTGITTMNVVLKLDAGDILEQDEFEIGEDMTAGELYEMLSELGANTLHRTLVKLGEGTLVRRPQNEDEATYFPMFKSGFGEINFNMTGEKIRNFVRGTNPAPGAFLMFGQEKIKVFKVSQEALSGFENEKNGTIVFADERRGLGIKAEDSVVLIDELRRPGAKKMSAKDSMRGKKLPVGYVFSGGTVF